MKNPTTAERRNDRELVVTRTFDAPARLVFEAWVRPELFKRWWVPASFGLNLLSCEMDVRTDGRTHVTVVDLYPSKEVLDAAIATGSTGGYPEQFEQLDQLLSG